MSKKEITLLDEEALYLEEGTYRLRVSSYNADSDSITVVWDVYDEELNILTKEADCFSAKRWMFVKKQLLMQAEKSFKNVKDMLEFFREHDVLAEFHESKDYGRQFNYRK